MTQEKIQGARLMRLMISDPPFLWLSWLQILAVASFIAIASWWAPWFAP